MLKVKGCSWMAGGDGGFTSNFCLVAVLGAAALGGRLGTVGSGSSRHQRVLELLFLVIGWGLLGRGQHDNYLWWGCCSWRSAGDCWVRVFTTSTCVHVGVVVGSESSGQRCCSRVLRCYLMLVIMNESEQIRKLRLNLSGS